MVSQGSQFSVRDVEVVTAVMDLEEIRSFRGAIASRSVQAASVAPLPRIKIKYSVTGPITSNGHTAHSPFLLPSAPMMPHLHTPEEEIGLGPACWLWDYLRRSGASGFFLPLSGGADSAATAAIVGIMSHLVVEAIARGDELVLADARRVAGFKKSDTSYRPTDPIEFMNRVLHTCYMGTSNSSSETNKRAASIAREIGCYHLTVNIDTMISAILTVFTTLTGKTPQYKVHGGSVTENLALQNIQARMRMVFSYLLAQLLPWVRGRPGFLLVLGSANVDEALRGYMTKYDCSSADLNPIGGIAKGDLKRFLLWASKRFPFPTLESVVRAPPTAELEPITQSYTQTDEEDMGMSYEELGIFGRLRKIYRCGPVSMYQKLVAIWGKKDPSQNPSPPPRPSIPSNASSPSSSSSSPAPFHSTPGMTPTQVAAKVQSFFYFYSVNRHKLTTLTPSYHAENYSPEDNRFDLRQFLYNNSWRRQCEVMNRLVAADEAYRQAEISQRHVQANKNNKFVGGEGDTLIVRPGTSHAQL